MNAGGVRPKQDRPVLGIAMMLFAYFLFSFIDTGVKWLVLAGLPALQLAFMRYAGHFVLSLAVLLRGGAGLGRFRSPRIGLVALRGVLLAVATVLNFVALRYLPLTLTSTILFLAPVIVCALSWPLLGEWVGIYRSSAVVLGFVGILVAIRPFGEEFHWATLLSLGATTGFAFYTMITRRLSGEVSSDIMQFYTGFIGTVMLLPAAILVWRSPETGFDWAIMLATGVFGWLGHEMLTRAFRFASASVLTPYGYSFIIYLTVWSLVVFGVTPDGWTIAGAVIVAASGLIIWGREVYLARARPQAGPVA